MLKQLAKQSFSLSLSICDNNKYKLGNSAIGFALNVFLYSFWRLLLDVRFCLQLLLLEQILFFIFRGH